MQRVIRHLDSAQRWVLQPLFVLLVIAGGFLGARALSTRRAPPPRRPDAVYAPLVEFARVSNGRHTVVVRGNGELTARTRIGLVAEVGGEVIAMHPELRAGGRFAAGELLLELEPREYELALARAEADIAGAETALQEIRARAAAASAEWRALQGDKPAPPLVVLEPQVAEAEARKAAATAARDRAALDLQRTTIRARFAGRVVSASVDVGQVVVPNTRLGEVYAADVLEVAVPVRTDELGWITLPGDPSDAIPTAVTLQATLGTQRVVLDGAVARLEAELTRGTRLARVVVALPLAAVPEQQRVRLLPGTFVEAAFEGAKLDSVVALPERALREGDIVWCVTEGRVRFVPVEVVRRSREALLVRGLADGTEVITSDLAVVTDGMSVRVTETGARQ